MVPSHTICPITASDDAIVTAGQGCMQSTELGASDMESSLPSLGIVSAAS